MGVLKMLTIGIVGLTVVSGAGIGILYMSEQSELDAFVEWEDFNKRWDSVSNNRKIRQLEAELKKICSDQDTKCETKHGILEVINKKFEKDTAFRDRLTDVSGIGTSINQVCKRIISQLEYVKAFCPI